MTEVISNMARKKDPGQFYQEPFAKRLRALMNNEENISPLHRKVSQKELASVTGITRQALNAYTLGNSVPDINRFRIIAEFFGVSCDYLLGRTDATDYEYAGLVNELGLSQKSLQYLREKVEEKRKQEKLINEIRKINEDEGRSFSFACLSGVNSIDVLNLILEENKILDCLSQVLTAPKDNDQFYVLPDGHVIWPDNISLPRDPICLLIDSIPLNNGKLLENISFENLRDRLLALKAEHYTELTKNGDSKILSESEKIDFATLLRKIKIL